MPKAVMPGKRAALRPISLHYRRTLVYCTINNHFWSNYTANANSSQFATGKSDARTVPFWLLKLSSCDPPCDCDTPLMR